MKNNILISIRLTLLFLVFFGGIYMITILGISKFVPERWSFSKTEGYYQNVGQSFTSDAYFWSRPSAVSYNAAGSGGSNKGPTNPDYLMEVQARIDTFLVHNPGIEKEEIPSELVTASGSGLDPHISVQAAKVQVPRISKMRNVPEETLQQLIVKQTEGPLFGLFGTEKINVLKLNLELDRITKSK